MEFDIHALDGLEPGSSKAEEALERYLAALLERFSASAEGQALLQARPGAGFWAEQLVYYGFNYQGAAVPALTVADVEEIVTELLPRKVTLQSPDDADGAIPELLSFWEYLKREHRLPQADPVLDFLRKVQPRFKGMMNDPQKFGMAKSFMMMGQAAGFDMTDKRQAETFFGLYNASVAGELAAEAKGRSGGEPELLPPSGSHRRHAKSRRKTAKKSRKQGRRKR